MRKSQLATNGYLKHRPEALELLQRPARQRHILWRLRVAAYYLLFLKIADNQSKPPYNQKSPVPEKYGWPSLIKKDNDVLLDHYRNTREALGNQKDLLGLIFGKA